MARTAVWQPADSLATLFCRQDRASLPPGVTPEQCDWKSERQFERIALCWAEVTWALPLAVNVAKISAPSHSVDARRDRVASCCIIVFPFLSAVGSAGSPPKSKVS